MKRTLFIFLLCIAHNPLSAQKKIIIDNNAPKTDVTGQIVDAHDGRVIEFDGIYYWYGTQYGKTNGFVETNKYVSYTSKDLKNWSNNGQLLFDSPKGVYYRPHVIYNKKTKKYVLWYNWYPKLWNGQFGVAISDKPNGPFKIVNDNVKVRHSNLGVGDLGLFVDQDGKAYLSYNTINGHNVSVEELADDYQSSKLNGSEFIVSNCEAGSMFKRNNKYYLMTDYTCCFCTQGSGARVYVADNVLGPYKYTENINRYPGNLASLITDGNSLDNQFLTFKAKKNQFLEIRLENNEAITNIHLYQFTGNREGQCGDVANPKVHDPITEYKFELEYFNDGEWSMINNPPVKISRSALLMVYELNLNSIKTERIRIKPVFEDTNIDFHLSEIKLDKVKGSYQAYFNDGESGKPIIPGQQSYVMELKGKNGPEFIWMSDLWGSANDNIKGHDFQYWSSPLKFYNNGNIKPLKWEGKWELKLK